MIQKMLKVWLQNDTLLTKQDIRLDLAIVVFFKEIECRLQVIWLMAAKLAYVLLL